MTPHLSPCVVTDSLVFCSGQLAFDAQRRIDGDVSAQTVRCLENLAGVLATQGLGLGDVLKATVWLRHAGDFAAFDAAYAQVFGAHRPARSTVVSALVVDAALVEIEAVARRAATA